MANSSITRQPFWLNKSRMAESLGISTQAFDKWGVEPVAKVGRESFYDVKSVVANRLAHQEQKHQPMGAEGEGLDPLIEQKLMHERHRLTKEQADTQQMKNEVRRKTHVPADFAVFALARFAALVGSTLDTVHVKLKRKHPDFEPRHLEAVQREIAVTRNEAASLAEQLPEILSDYVDTMAEESD